jgi:hypothetical protein
VETAGCCVGGVANVFGSRAGAGADHPGTLGQGGVQFYIGFLVSKFVQFQILFKFELLLSFSKLVQFELCSNSKFVNILNLFKFEVCLDSNFAEIRE